MRLVASLAYRCVLTDQVQIDPHEKYLHLVRSARNEFWSSVDVRKEAPAMMFTLEAKNRGHAVSDLDRGKWYLKASINVLKYGGFHVKNVYLYSAELGVRFERGEPQIWIYKTVQRWY